ncbi:Crp/Fnr family transcriptional regulator [Spongiivirga sp. MCCC 1A20706]|uniref:Crp/Fnr family transcriptional regulator n=1 Tax=Spongiivirga sp. MCCC 1A20706 TaxID=3160963 RepID=UPI0039773C9A
MINIEDILNSHSNVKARTFKKGHIIQQAESSATPSIYVKKGILRSYIIDSNGKEHIYMFASKGYIIGDIEAMEYHQSTQLYIDCLEDCEVILFDKEQLLTILSKEHTVIFNQLLSRRIGRLQRRVLMLMGAPAIDRYAYFLEIYPELPIRVPQKMIASYLGISPQTLSSIRSEIARRK